jgi:hypothetical protein
MAPKKCTWVCVNKRVNGRIPPHDVYCGNGWLSQGLYPGKWANPFDNVFDQTYSREEALELYKYMFNNYAPLKETVHELDGKVLADHSPHPGVSHCTFLTKQARLAAQRIADAKSALQYAMQAEEDEEDEEEEEDEVPSFLLTPPSSKMPLKKQQAFLKAPKRSAAQPRVPLKKRPVQENLTGTTNDTQEPPSSPEKKKLNLGKPTPPTALEEDSQMIPDSDEDEGIVDSQ